MPRLRSPSHAPALLPAVKQRCSRHPLLLPAQGPTCWAQLDSLVGDLPASCCWHAGPSQEPQAPTAAHPLVPPPHLLHIHLAHKSRGNFRGNFRSPPKAFFQPRGLSFIFFYSPYACNQPVLGSHNNRGILQAPDLTAKRLPKCRAQCNQQQTAPCPMLTPPNSLEHLHLLPHPLAFQFIYFRVCKANSHFPQD